MLISYGVLMLGDKLRQLREGAGETRLELAVAAKTTPTSIYNIEVGISKNPHIKTLKKLADHYGLTVDALLDGQTDFTEAVS